MKRIIYYPLVLVTVFAVACNQVSYKKTSSGLLYKIFPSNTKDSIAKTGDWLKLHFTQKIEDSVLQTSYGKLPVYTKISETPGAAYTPTEIFNLLKKGDSVITVAITDSLLSKGLIQELPPYMKKGQKITTVFRVVDVFKDDSAYQKDFQAEYEKDAPRREQEQKDQMEKMRKEMQDQMKIEEEEMEKSGESAKGIQEMETYLASKKINAQKTGKGTYVLVKDPGTGAAVETGKYVKVKYSGRVLRSDSTFESNTYAFQLDIDPVIAGWSEGLKLFKEGGKGTLYIPGFRAYGKKPGPGNQPFEALIFDVEVLQVSDQQILQELPRQQ